MARGLIPTLAMGALVAALCISAPATLSGCSEENDPFVTRHCMFNDNPRVSSDRIVTLFAVNYVYAFTAEFETPIDRAEYIGFAEVVIKDAYGEVNRILRENHINLQIASLTVYDKDVARLNVSGTSPNAIEMVQVHEGRGRLIGVHWSEWVIKVGDNVPPSWSAPGHCPPRPASEFCNWLNLAGYIRHPLGVAATGRDLAKAFGWYFNLAERVGTSDNLMSKMGEGTMLDQAQRDAMWTSINTSYHTNLSSVTCDPPVQLAPWRPEIRSRP